MDCKDRRGGCCMCAGGKCLALWNTDFKGKPCPFYKTKEQRLEEMQECALRLKALGKK